MYLKILNLIQQNGSADYKGLELASIVSGTQLYPSDENTAYLKYEGKVIKHSDIQVLTDGEYQNIFQKEKSKPQPKTEVDVIKEENERLRQQLANTNADFQALMDVLVEGGVI